MLTLTDETKHNLRLSYREIQIEQQFAVYREQKNYWSEIWRVKEELNIPDYPVKEVEE